MECMLILSIACGVLLMMLPRLLWRVIRDETRRNQKTAAYVAELERARRSQENKNGDSAPVSHD